MCHTHDSPYLETQPLLSPPGRNTRTIHPLQATPRRAKLYLPVGNIKTSIRKILRHNTNAPWKHSNISTTYPHQTNNIGPLTRRRPTIKLRYTRRLRMKRPREHAAGKHRSKPTPSQQNLTPIIPLPHTPVAGTKRPLASDKIIPKLHAYLIILGKQGQHLARRRAAATRSTVKTKEQSSPTRNAEPPTAAPTSNPQTPPAYRNHPQRKGSESRSQPKTTDTTNPGPERKPRMRVPIT